MATTPQDVITRNLVVGVKESISDVFELLDPTQVPLINMLGFDAPAKDTTHFWYEDEMFGTETTLLEEATADATELTVADVEGFRKDHIVMAGEEYLKVTDIDKENNKLTVVRGYSGTEAEDIKAGDKLDIQFLEGAEGMDAVDARYKPRRKVSNATQIFTDTIKLSGTQLAVENHNIENLYNYELDKIITLLANQLEKSVLNGVYLDDGSTVRRMRGIRNFVKTNVMPETGKLDYDKIVDALQAIQEAGGFANGGSQGYEIIVGTKLKRAISKFGADFVRTSEEDNTRGMKIDYLATEFGEFPVTINNNLKDDEVLIIDKNRIFIRPLQGREFFHEYLGKQGDRVEGMVVGEYTVEVQQEKAHALLKGVTV